LVDQDDVPGALDLAEDRPYLACELGRCLSGPAGKKEEGVVAGRVRQRRQHDNPKADLPSNSCVAVLEDRHRPAQRVSRTFAAQAGV
jgi:hypothetical protein